jgi:hypothetical protein
LVRFLVVFVLVQLHKNTCVCGASDNSKLPHQAEQPPKKKARTAKITDYM